MKITRNSSDIFAYEVDSSLGKIGINQVGKDLSVYLSQQPEGKTREILHWPGEYEINGVSVFLQLVGGENFLAKIFVEGVRVVFFNDTGVSELGDVHKFFGNTDVLVLGKDSQGLAKADMKKLIEKVDPRVLIGASGNTEAMLKDFSFPLDYSDSVKITKSSLPSDQSLYFIV